MRSGKNRTHHGGRAEIISRAAFAGWIPPIGENLELIQEIASNSDNINYGEMIHAHDGSEEGITTFTDRGIESLKEFLADICTWNGGVRQFLVDEQCDQERIERIIVDEPKS